VLGSDHEARFELRIPNDLLLLGAALHTQAIVLDPSAGNPLGAVMSDAMTAFVGGR
jgi:hypothetical protein